MTRVLGIVSGKGGVGKTTITANLGIGLSKFGKKAIIVDCNLSTPHLNYYLGADDFKITLNEVLKGETEITSALYHHNGVMYVPASQEMADLIDVDVMRLKKNVKKLMNPDMIDFIILDSAPGLGREAMSVFEAADEIVFVSTPLEPNIQDIERCLEIVKELNKQPLGLILNMVGEGKYEMNTKQIKDMAKMPIIGTVPFDKNIPNSIALRKPILKFKPHSKTSNSIMRIVASITGEKFKPSPHQKVFQFFDVMRELVAR